MALRTDRSPISLSVETLESRTVLSTATASSWATAAAVQQPAAKQMTINYTQPASTTSVQTAAVAANANFSYGWGVGPRTIFQGTNSATGNGKSTGSVAFALAKPGTDSDRIDGSASKTDFGYIMVSSSATAARPDVYNTTFTLQLRIRDAASGASGVLTFRGTIKGTANAYSSSLNITLQNPTQSIALGRNVYKVSLPSNMPETGPRSSPTWIQASIMVTKR